MLMMMMMRRKTWRLLMSVALLMTSAHCLLPPPSTEELGQVSVQGERYVAQQVEDAVQGVEEMKHLMEKSGQQHQRFLEALEKTRQKKEEAFRTAREMETKLEKAEEGCNDTMKALWEECKPCLKRSCIKYYSRTCSRGAGIVGRQLEEVLNRTSPFSIWINGEKVNLLEHEDRNQDRRFHNLEEQYSEVARGVENMFLDSMKVFTQMRSLHPGSFHSPTLWGKRPDAVQIHQGAPAARTLTRSQRDQGGFLGFHSAFVPMMDVAQGLLGSMDPMRGPEDTLDEASEEGTVNEDVVVTRPLGNGDQMTCREIRRNSAGCIKLRDKCEKCREIQDLDCSGSRPLHGPLKEHLERALAAAESLAQEYSALLGRMEQQMINTSSLLDLLDRQFGWVSALANGTKTKNGIFQVQAVVSTEGDEASTSPSVDTKVSVQLFDSPPMTFAVPGDIPWSDPKFSEVVAQEALERYKQSSSSSSGMSLPVPAATAIVVK